MCRVVFKRITFKGFVTIWLWIGFAVGLASCPHKKNEKAQSKSLPEHIVISEVSVRFKIPQFFQSKGLSEEKLKSWALEKIKGAKYVMLKKNEQGDSYRLRLELGVGHSESQPNRIAVIISATADPQKTLERPTFQAGGIVPLKKKPGEIQDSRLQSQMRKACDSVLKDILYQAKLSVANDKTFLKALAEKDLPRLSAAIDIAAYRRLKAAVPALIKLLKRPETRIVDQAVGALVAIRDQRAVKALTRMSKFSDTARLAKIIDGIGAIGGQEAKDYLEFLATGHEDADIRMMASEALKRMHQKEKKRSTQPH